MKIEIETNGVGTETNIIINGEIQDTLKFFEFSVNVERSNKVKLFMIRKVDGKYIPMEFYGEGIRKFDEAGQITKEMTNDRHIGTERKA